MKMIYSAALGVLTGIAAVLLHMLYPPFGLTLSILGSATTIWAIGRHFGARKFKLIASLAWSFILWLVFLGLLALFIVIALPA
jgi:Na+-driven multidrug efflux pump